MTDVKNIDIANQMLSFLYANSQAYTAGLNTVYTDTQEHNKARLNVNKKYRAIKDENKLNPGHVGIYPHSTLDAIIYFGVSINRKITPAEAKEIWSILKEHNRIIQLGGGRGRAIVVAIAQPIEVEEVNQGLIDPTDPQALLKALTNQVSDSEAYKKLIEEKDKELIEVKKQNNILTAQAATQTRTNWT